jgi:hypothetical protein
MSFLCFYQTSIVWLKAEHEISRKIYYIARGPSTCIVTVRFWIGRALSHLCPAVVPPFQSCGWALKMWPVSAVFWWNSINWRQLTSTRYFQKVSLHCMPMRCSRNSVYWQGAEGIKGHTNVAEISVMSRKFSAASSVVFASHFIQSNPPLLVRCCVYRWTLAFIYIFWSQLFLLFY